MNTVRPMFGGLAIYARVNPDKPDEVADDVVMKDQAGEYTVSGFNMGITPPDPKNQFASVLAEDAIELTVDRNETGEFKPELQDVFAMGSNKDVGELSRDLEAETRNYNRDRKDGRFVFPKFDFDEENRQALKTAVEAAWETLPRTPLMDSIKRKVLARIENAVTFSPSVALASKEMQYDWEVSDRPNTCRVPSKA